MPAQPKKEIRENPQSRSLEKRADREELVGPEDHDVAKFPLGAMERRKVALKNRREGEPSHTEVRVKRGWGKAEGSEQMLGKGWCNCKERGTCGEGKCKVREV